MWKICSEPKTTLSDSDPEISLVYSLVREVGGIHCIVSINIWQANIDSKTGGLKRKVTLDVLMAGILWMLGLP